MTDEVHICSLIVLVNPTLLACVRATLTNIFGVEIHAEDAHGKLVVVLETDSERQISTTIDAINYITGVLNTTMVYHHCEPAAALQEEVFYECKPT
jgi:nitrate reductase NapD